MNFQASKLCVRIEIAGLTPHFRAFWILVKLVGKACLSLALLWAVLWFFYFRHFRIRHFEPPYDGINYVADTDDLQRNDFRKRSVSAVTDPIRQQLAKIFFQDLWTLAKFVGKVCFWVSLFFGPLCIYYANYFYVRPFEDPTAGLTYVTDTDPAQRNEFRNETITFLCTPLEQQLRCIREIRLQTKSGKVHPKSLDQDLTEIRTRLKQIMREARRRRIPKEFKKHYEPSIFAIQDAFRSINDLEDSFGQETEFARKKLYNDSIKKWKAATKKTNRTRDYFSRYEWPRPPERKEHHWRSVKAR